MKNYSFGLLILSFCFFACSSSQESENFSFSLILEDSVLIDYLEPRYLVDYDRSTGHFLLSNESYYRYIEVDESGKISWEDSIPWDGPGAVSMILGMGYVNGKVGIATDLEGFKFYEKGNSTDQLKIPYSYTSFTFLPKLSLIPWNGGFLYPKFMAESDLEGGFTDDFYKRTYTDSLFSFQSNEESVRFLISLPQESKFLNGEYHGSLIPVPFLEGKEFYLLNWIRPEILHYQQQGNEFIYQKTVNLDLENWVSYDEVPLNQASKFYDSFGKKMPGTFRDIFSIGDYLVVQYTLGISEDTFSQAKGESGRLDPEKIYQLNPPLLAVLDKELNVLAKGIVLPNGVNGQLVVDRKGRLVGQKNPSLSSVEESNLVLYRMNLKAY